jgi:hypothetical protein
MRYGDAAWKAKGDLTEPSPVEADGGELIGRDPRQLSKETLAKH